MSLFIPEYILALDPYVPGKPLEELERERKISRSIKLASNENPMGPSPLAVKAIQAALSNLHRYPDGSAHQLIGQLADHLSIAPQRIILGNGSDEIIGMLAQVLLRPGDEVILPRPSFLMYQINAQSTGATIIPVALRDQAIDLRDIQKRITPKTRIIFICNPNNPTGTVVTKDMFEDFLSRVPAEVVVVVDEAYIEFVRDAHCLQSINYQNEERQLVTLRTFSKAYGLAGIRIGYGVMPTYLANILNRVRQPFNANSLAQAASCAALKDRAFLAKTISLVHEGLDSLYRGLSQMGVRYFSSQANFLLVDVKSDADEVFDRLLDRGVIVRSMRSYGYPHYIRVSVGLPEENLAFLKALALVFLAKKQSV